MTIAVNTSFLTGDILNGIDDFVFECFSRLAKLYPQQQFIYIADKGFDNKYCTSKNISVSIAGSPTKNPLLLQYRLNYKIPALLRKHKVDVFVNAGGYCSLRTKVPQCIIVNDLSFLHTPQFFAGSWLRFYKKNTVQFLNKAKAIITNSHFLKQEIIDRYKLAADKITVAHYGCNNNFKSIDWQQQETIKEKYTEGKEYFLYLGPIHPKQNLLALLKAFSFFKKRQKSNMQLVIASKKVANDPDFIKSLASFKYRKEVALLENLPVAELAAITAAAYAMVYPSTYETVAATLIESMHAGIPVIASDTTAMPEIGGTAALYINADDFNDIADKMMLLFKDENKRNELIMQGRQQAALYNWDNAAGTVWNNIMKCADKPQ